MSKIRIVCDDPAHALSVVTAFTPTQDGWTEVAGKGQQRQDSGTTLSADNERYRAQDYAAGHHRDLRVTYRLVCRRCRNRALVVREERLFAILTALGAAGVSQVSMSGLRASLSERVKPSRGR